jgi:hypothetical protein
VTITDDSRVLIATKEEKLSFYQNEIDPRVLKLSKKNNAISFVVNSKIVKCYQRNFTLLKSESYFHINFWQCWRFRSLYICILIPLEVITFTVKWFYVHCIVPRKVINSLKWCIQTRTNFAIKIYSTESFLFWLQFGWFQNSEVL